MKAICISKREQIKGIKPTYRIAILAFRPKILDIIDISKHTKINHIIIPKSISGTISNVTTKVAKELGIEITLNNQDMRGIRNDIEPIVELDDDLYVVEKRV